ncbi:MAG: fluoride efflux transporter CrcB [Cyclobacteriaceae bacterium]|nr:fluoride efflux transporter CrcB [Cyclobacteriaceae bacterium]UYN86289.1 MAG: fluoride efflux transporter CrcB [Cyclobacteriaceae bacterium]
MVKLLFIALGGALGSLARYGASGLAHQKYNGVFPVGTLTVNLVGSFLIGLLWGLAENSTLNPNVRTFLFVGILGGFTTFSTFSLETINLLRDGEFKLALVNVLLNNLVGIVLAFVGLMLAKNINT